MPPPSLPTLTTPFSEMVYKNKSVEGSVNVPSFDRLVLIGASAVQLGVMIWLNGHYPNEPRSDFLDKLVKLTNRKPSSWARSYKLGNQCIPPSPANSQTSPPPSSELSSSSSVAHQPNDNDLFCAFIGALFLEKGDGYLATSRLIRSILDHEVKDGVLENDAHDSPSEQNFISSLLGRISNNKASKDNEKTGKGGLNNDTGNAVSRLYELISKADGRKELLWKSSAEGDDHIPTWTMELSIDGYEKKFTVTAKNKKTAKVLAAELALDDQNLLHFLDPQST